jgi:hypothetical protein
MELEVQGARQSRANARQLIPFEGISSERMQAVATLIGLSGSEVKVAAKLNRQGTWSLYRKKEGSSANDRQWKERARCDRIDDVLAYFRQMGARPYCLEDGGSQRKTKPRNSRKKVQLTGTYCSRNSDKPADMVVEELSVSGLKFYAVAPIREICAGDELMVKVQLNDERSTQLRKRVTVKQVIGHFVDVRFRQLHIDTELDRYLR